MALIGIKGNYPLSLNDPSREFSRALDNASTSLCCYPVNPVLLCLSSPAESSVGGWSLDLTLYELYKGRQSGVPSPSSSQGIKVPKGLSELRKCMALLAGYPSVAYPEVQRGSGRRQDHVSVPQVHKKGVWSQLCGVHLAHTELFYLVFCLGR